MLHSIFRINWQSFSGKVGSTNCAFVHAVSGQACVCARSVRPEHIGNEGSGVDVLSCRTLSSTVPFASSARCQQCLVPTSANRTTVSDLLLPRLLSRRLQRRGRLVSRLHWPLTAPDSFLQTPRESTRNSDMPWLSRACARNVCRHAFRFDDPPGRRSSPVGLLTICPSRCQLSRLHFSKIQWPFGLSPQRWAQIDGPTLLAQPIHFAFAPGCSQVCPE